LRLGVGLGWNQVEYVALGESFHNRGRRIEEQIALMRELWARELVTFGGRWHNVPDAGLNPLPVQRPIPIWFGGHAEPVLRRLARLGDGWMTNFRTAADARPALDSIDRFLAEAGRSRADIGLEARIAYGDGNRETWQQRLEEWQAAGATHVSFNTMYASLRSPGEHLDALRAFAEVAGVSSG
jgi:alkanesulfonate monooxygenase SsuD/methylene tetrahydromethanopterin reductase-like flavin-dependent oxidoreductase (luciferase family)